MAVIAGSFEATLTGGIGGSGPTSPLASGIEGVTGGHWDGLDVFTFPPLPGVGETIGNEIPIEVLYPITPSRKNNKLLFRTDLQNWVHVRKSKVLWSHEFTTIQFRLVKGNYMNTFYQFLEDNLGKLVLLSLPGVQPFLRSTEDNLVFIKSFSKPLRENHIKYRIDVTFLFNPNLVG